MSDQIEMAIARIQALEVMAVFEMDRVYNQALHNAIAVVKGIPSAQPERKTGKWVECDHEKWVVGVHALRCSECNGGYHLSNEMTIYYWNFCPNCGADMKGE